MATAEKSFANPNQSGSSATFTQSASSVKSWVEGGGIPPYAIIESARFTCKCSKAALTIVGNIKITVGSDELLKKNGVIDSVSDYSVDLDITKYIASGGADAGCISNDIVLYFSGPTRSTTWYVREAKITYTYSLPNYNVTWANIDGEGAAKVVSVARGTVPQYSGTPSKESDVQYHYTFDYWSPTPSAALSDVIYWAEFSTTLRQYTLTVTAGGVGGTVTGGGTYDYGKEVTLTATPNSSSSEFVKWSDEITTDTRKVTVKGNASYQAIFELKSYTVTFKDDNGTTLKTESVQHGSKPTPPTNPTKADTAQWDYTFDGWYDGNGNKWTSNTTITGAITFTARYSSVVQKYTVRWFNHDGTLLETDTNVPYGTKPTYNGATPTKAGNAQYSYRHIGWNYDLNVGITGAIDITAQFAQDINTYTVQWVNEGKVIETDELVPYGTQPDYNGATPTKESDAQFDYDFIGWSAEVNDPPVDDTQLETVKGHIVYTAVYSKTTRIYPIKIILFDTETEYAFEYGKELNINAPAVIGYKFVKWSDGNTDAFRTIQVTGEATYQAVYERSSIPLRVGTEQVTGVYIVPDTNTIVYVISGTVPTVTTKTDTVDGWNFEVSNSIPENSYPLEKLYINRTRVW